MGMGVCGGGVVELPEIRTPNRTLDYGAGFLSYNFTGAG